MHYKKCEICGIRAGRIMDQKRPFMAKFPLDEVRCKKWVKFTGNEDLACVPIEKLHALKHICGKHFRPRDFKKKKTQLKRSAIPCLFLNAEPLNDEILKEFPLHIFTNKKILHQDAVLNESVALNQCLKIGPSTSNTELVPIKPDNPNSYSDHDYCQCYVEMPEHSMLIEETKDTRKRSYSPRLSTISNTGNIKFTKKTRSYSPKPSTSSAPLDINNIQADTLCDPKVSKAIITPREATLLNKLRKSKNKAKSLQKRLSEIENISSPMLKSLIESTLKNQKRKPRGKRWTKLNKTVALAICKKSPKAYRYLSQLLPMPSVKTLQLILQNMKMEPGLDPSIVSHLKGKAKNLTDGDKML